MNLEREIELRATFWLVSKNKYLNKLILLF